METISYLFNLVFHIDAYLLSFVANYGHWTYILLFMIIFSETGLIVVPFLPGDSLLFTAGSIAANPESQLSIQLLAVLLILASTIGNKVNYLVGRAIGPRIFHTKSSWLFNKRHLAEAHQFYEKHGGKTIIFARFIPIVRTFAPFVAGVGYMNLVHFSLYNIVSAILWIVSMLMAGYFFGTLPFVKDHFSLVVYGIVLLSISPPLIALAKRRICRPA